MLDCTASISGLGPGSSNFRVADEFLEPKWLRFQQFSMNPKCKRNKIVIFTHKQKPSMGVPYRYTPQKSLSSNKLWALFQKIL